MNYRRKFSILQTLCTSGSLMTQFANLDIEKNLQCIFTSNKMLVSHKWSTKYTNKYSIIKNVLKVSNVIILMLNFICWKLHYLEVTWHNDNKVIWIFITQINRLMLHQDNWKKLSTKETIMVSQDCPKLLGSPVTCCSQRVKWWIWVEEGELEY